MNASIEAAHQVLAVSGLGASELGTTVTPTVLSSGTTSNTVPAAAGFAVDVRVRSLQSRIACDAAMLALRPVLAGAELEITGGHNRPPLERTASEASVTGVRASWRPTSASIRCLRHQSAAPPTATSPPASASPTLDGLGAVGGGAHADHEHVIVAELPRRTSLLAALLTDLLSEKQQAAAGGASGADRLSMPAPAGVADSAGSA